MRTERSRWDAASLLVLFVLLLVGIPSRLDVGAIGAAGTPANLFGIALLLWWLNARMVPRLGVARGRQPMRLALGAFSVAVLASYASAMVHGWPSPAGIAEKTTLPMNAVPTTRAELTATLMSGADRGLLGLAAWAGVLLVAADGIRSIPRLLTLLRWLVAAVTVMAALGIVQFFTGIDIAGAFHIPGLRVNGEFGLIFERSSFHRVMATAIHPIEFGVVLAACLPIAVHFALHARHDRGVLAAGLPWLACGLIGVGAFMSLSRAAILASGVAFLVLFAGWESRRRRHSLLMLPFLLIGLRVAVPGLVGTVRALFTNIGVDPSTTNRADDLPTAFRLIGDHLLFGNGFFTFLPNVYRRIFDDQWVLTAVEMGLIGFTALFLLFCAGFASARGARKRSTDSEVRHLGQALAASVAALAVSYATFDAFSFPMVASLTFLLLGCSGALWRLTGGASTPLGGRHEVQVPRPRAHHRAELAGSVGQAGVAGVPGPDGRGIHGLGDLPEGPG